VHVELRSRDLPHRLHGGGEELAPTRRGVLQRAGADSRVGVRREERLAGADDDGRLAVARHVHDLAEDAHPPHGTVRRHDPIREREVAALAHRAANRLAHVVGVVGVGEAHEGVHAGEAVAAGEPEDLRRLVRPGDGVGAEIPGPAAGRRDVGGHGVPR